MDPPSSPVDLAYRLRGLAMAGAVLHLGAHPDDEDSGMLAYFAGRHAVRTVYWSATRGEGGQNRRGSESGEALGVVRTWETLEARRVDRAEALYGPFYDFGFSKHGVDCLDRWGREAVVREVVRAIRAVQPLLVISRWAPDGDYGHGQHQAIGLVAEEALAAAADPDSFPDLVDAGLPPWQVTKHYRSLGPDWQPGEGVVRGEVVTEHERAGHLRLDAGEVDPITGMSYQQHADLALNRHQSQGMAVVPQRGPFLYYYRLEGSRTAGGAADRGFFAGIDPALTGLVDAAAHPRVHSALAESVAAARQAVEAYRPGSGEGAGELVLAGLRALRSVRPALESAAMTQHERAALERYLAVKERAFEEVAAACFGVGLDCVLDRARVVPGGSLVASVRARSAGPTAGLRVEPGSIGVVVPPGWDSAARGELGEGAAGQEVDEVLERVVEITVPPTAAPTAPYWLREGRDGLRYRWPANTEVGEAFETPLVMAEAVASLHDTQVRLRAPGLHESAFVGGVRQMPLAVSPPVVLLLQTRHEMLSTHGHEQVVELAATLRCVERVGQASLRLHVPEGWEVSPASVQPRLERADQTSTARFEVTVPAGVAAGRYQLRYEIDADGSRYQAEVEPVRIGPPGAAGPVDGSSCVAEAFQVRDAAVEVSVIDVQLSRSLRFAYIPGLQDDLVASIGGLGLDVTTLDPERLPFEDLSAFHAVVVGPNAYLTRAALREHARRLLDYAAAGGTLIVQYQGFGYEAEGLAPYPFRYSRPHDRVTAPDAPVTALNADHPLLTEPNRIGEADWDGWTHDRGMYFWGEWDPRYRSLLTCCDPGEEPLAGGLLVAGYGCGTYAYVAYSLFRQVPAGVPGAVRLLANLLGLAEARVRERVERLRTVELFEALPDEDLEALARVTSERRIPHGELLCQEGDRGTELYLLVEGEIEACKGERVIHVAGPGESMGELAVLADVRRSASLRARGDATVLVVGRAELRSRLRRDPDLAEDVMAYLARKLAPLG